MKKGCEGCARLANDAVRTQRSAECRRRAHEAHDGKLTQRHYRADVARLRSSSVSENKTHLRNGTRAPPLADHP